MTVLGRLASWTGVARRAACLMASLLASLLACLLALAAAPVGAGTVHFTPEERERVLSHGPWPMARLPDPSNRAEGQAAAVALGQRLFADPRLSATGQMACATCHVPQRAFQDGRTFTRHGRNTPSLLDVGQHRWFGWDGAADSLWAASLTPLVAPDELGTTSHHAHALLQRDARLRTSYQQVFGPPQVNEQLLVNLAKALAAYQVTLASGRTQFDVFRDALATGDTRAAARYPQSAQRGLKLFVGEARCFVCHTGPHFTNGEFADIGRPFFTQAGADPGRWGGLRHLLASPHNRLGPHSDAPAQHPSAHGTRHVVVEPRHFGEFRVPSLRGLVHTAPYFHDGSAPTLEAVVRHYSTLDETRLHADGERVLRPLHLSQAQVADLVAFLRTLSTPAGGQ